MGDGKKSSGATIAMIVGGVLIAGCLICMVGPSLMSLLLMGFDDGMYSSPSIAYEEPYDPSGSPTAMGLELPDKQGPIQPRRPSYENEYEDEYESFRAVAMNIEWEVTSVVGNLNLETGARCSFLLERRERSGGYWCQTRITCRGLDLYGDGSSNGYLECTTPDYSDEGHSTVWAEDADFLGDTDGAVVVRGAEGTIRIEDDPTSAHGAFVVEGILIPR